MRNFFLFAIILFSFTLPGSSKADLDGIILKNFPENSVVISETETVPSINLLGDIIILPETDFDQAEAVDMIGRIGRLPEDILEKIRQKGIQLKLFQGKLTDNFSASHLRGEIPRGYQGEVKWDDVPGAGGSKLVLAKIGASEKGKGHGSVNLELHELAHSIDRLVFDKVRESRQFQKIWNREKESLFPGQAYFLEYPEEYFAEAFAMYYLGGEEKLLLEEKAPETARFIKRLI